MTSFSIDQNSLFSFFWIAHKNAFLYCYRPRKAIIHFSDYKIDLIKEKKTLCPFCIDDLELSEPLCEKIDGFRVVHTYFELGYLVEKISSPYPNEPLAIEIHYTKSRLIAHQHFITRRSINISLQPKAQVDTGLYQKKINEIFAHLYQGNCYQVNYTHLFRFSFNPTFSKPVDFIDQLYAQKKHIGAFAHGTWIPFEKKMILSNTPECLFRLKKKRQHFEVYAMPIKGSLTFQTGQLAMAKKILGESKKDEGELNMITDLVRNDLARIDEPLATVVEKKRYLKVPEILHQYSLISQQLPPQIKKLQLLKSLFPGGSITGAPKKRVMQLIGELETEARGIYCGSTFFSHAHQFSASINIRTALVDWRKKELAIGAGGGITLLSDWQEEYTEMNSKLESFVGLLKSDRG